MGPKPMNALLTGLLMVGSVASAETLLVCNGESVKWFDDSMNSPRVMPLNDELTLVIDGNSVETDGHAVEFSHKDGNTWVWSFEWRFETGDVSKWLFNLNTISGQLKKLAFPTTGETDRVESIAEYQCQRVEQRLIE